MLYSVSRMDAKEDKNHSDLWMMRWDGTANAWGPPADGPTAPNGDPIRGITVRRSTVNGHRTLAMYTINAQNNHGSLFVFDWDGSKFVQTFTSDDLPRIDCARQVVVEGTRRLDADAHS